MRRERVRGLVYRVDGSVGQAGVLRCLRSRVDGLATDGELLARSVVRVEVQVRLVRHVNGAVVGVEVDDRNDVGRLVGVDRELDDAIHRLSADDETVRVAGRRPVVHRRNGGTGRREVSNVVAFLHPVTVRVLVVSELDLAAGQVDVASREQSNVVRLRVVETGDGVRTSAVGVVGCTEGLGVVRRDTVRLAFCGLADA